MIIFVEGLQGVGKTTLLVNLNRQTNHFPFAYYLNRLNSDSNDFLTGFQFGKDLGILFGLKDSPEDMIFDRGPISSIYYSLKENRCSEEILSRYLKEISSFKNCKYVIIEKVNAPLMIRNRQDGFDYLNDEEDKESANRFKKVEEMANQEGITFTHFQNDFALSLKENIKNFNDIIERLLK